MAHTHSTEPTSNALDLTTRSRRPDETDALGDAIAELAARIQAAPYELLVMIHQFDECGGWGQGLTSCAHWLNWRTGLAMGAAREKVRVARALADRPRLSDAMRRDTVSYSKVRTITRVATPETEERLLTFARSGTAAHVERLTRAWRRVDRIAAAEDDRRQHEGRCVRTWVDEDGMLVIRGRLSPELGPVVQRALEAATERVYQDAQHVEAGPDSQAPREDPSTSPTSAQRRPDALGLLAESALSADLDRGSTGDRYQVVVHVETNALKTDSETGQAVLDDGIRVSAETSRRVACDAGTVVMQHDRAGTVLDVGRKTRTIPPAIRRALASRDRHCGFPGCESRYCDAHHVRHWADGGATRLDNLVLLCRRHHRAVHEGGFAVERRQDGEVRFTHPADWPLVAAPSAPTWTNPPLAPIDARLEAAGIKIDRDTATPDWHGESLDLAWTIAVLHPGPPTVARSDVPAGTSSSRTGVAACREAIVAGASSYAQDRRPAASSGG